MFALIGYLYCFDLRFLVCHGVGRVVFLAVALSRTCLFLVEISFDTLGSDAVSVTLGSGAVSVTLGSGVVSFTNVVGDEMRTLGSDGCCCTLGSGIFGNVIFVRVSNE